MRRVARRRGSCAKAAPTRSSITPASGSTSANAATRSTLLAQRGAVGRRTSRCTSGRENATQIVPSPDGKWVAFAERYHAFVAAFPRSGRPVDLGPQVSAYPVARISRDAGMYLHWSGRQPRVLWALGPDLYSRDLSHTFAFVDSGREKPDEPEAKGVPIGFTTASDVPDGAVALEGARMVTMSGGAGRSGGSTTGVIENGTIVIEGNRITALGPRRHGPDPRRCRTHRRAGQDDHPGHHRRARARRRARATASSPRRTGRCWPTWRTA